MKEPTLFENQIEVKTDYYENGDIMSKTNWHYPTKKQIQFSIDQRNIIYDLKTGREKIRTGECFVYYRGGGIKHSMNYDNNGKLIESKSFRYDGSLITY